MRMSAASAMFIPAPAAAPFTAAITGCGISRIFSTACIPERRIGPSSVLFEFASFADGAEIAARTKGAARAAEYDDVNGVVVCNPREGIV